MLVVHSRHHKITVMNCPFAPHPVPRISRCRVLGVVGVGYPKRAKNPKNGHFSLENRPVFEAFLAYAGTLNIVFFGTFPLKTPHRVWHFWPFFGVFWVRNPLPRHSLAQNLHSLVGVKKG